MTNEAINKRDDLSKAIASAWSGNVQSGNAIARITADLLVMIGEGNGSVVFDTGTGDDAVSVSFDAETLGRYARGTLPSKAADAKAADMPTAAQMIGALADTAETVRNARDAMAAERAAANKAKSNPIVAAKHAAEAERIGQALNTLKAPIRRAMTLAAFVATSDAFDLSSARVDGGKLFVACDSGETDDSGAPIMREIAVTFAAARDAFSTDSAKKRAPNGETKQTAPRTGVSGEDDGVTAVVTAEAMRKGGEQRGKLADALSVVAGLLHDLDGAPTASEREAIARLYVACERLLDDDAMQRVADLRDADTDNEAA